MPLSRMVELSFQSLAARDRREALRAARLAEWVRGECLPAVGEGLGRAGFSAEVRASLRTTTGWFPTACCWAMPNGSMRSSSAAPILRPGPICAEPGNAVAFTPPTPRTPHPAHLRKPRGSLRNFRSLRVFRKQSGHPTRGMPCRESRFCGRLVFSQLGRAISFGRQPLTSSFPWMWRACARCLASRASRAGNVYSAPTVLLQSIRPKCIFSKR